MNGACAALLREGLRGPFACGAVTDRMKGRRSRGAHTLPPEAIDMDAYDEVLQ